MIPSATAALHGLALSLMTEVAPQLPDDYARASVGVMGFAQMLLAQELDRAVATRVWENDEIRRLFRAAARLVADQPLAKRLTDAAGRSDVDLRLSAVTAANTELRRLLIELQTAVEQLEAPAAREHERAIWEFLVAAAQRRAFVVG